MDKLNFIKKQMEALTIPYAYMEWTAKLQYPYWVGECSETPSETEDGGEESVFILTGTTRGSWYDLELQKDRIKKHFPAVSGLREKTDSGSIAVFFASAMPIPTGEADLKRIEINLVIKEWKGLE